MTFGENDELVKPWGLMECSKQVDQAAAEVSTSGVLVFEGTAKNVVQVGPMDTTREALVKRLNFIILN